MSIASGYGVEICGFEFRADRAYDPTEGFWVQQVADGVVRIGIHALAAEVYGALAQLVLDPAGTHLERGAILGSVEAAKFVGPLIAPVSGVVHRLNHRVLEDPETVLRDPYGEGWLLEIAEVDAAGMDLLVTGDLAAAWFEQTVTEHRANGLVAE